MILSFNNIGPLHHSNNFGTNLTSIFNHSASSTSIAALSAVLFLVVLPAKTSQAAQPQPTWKDMAQSDLDFTAKELKTLYISAVFPDPKAFGQRIAVSYDVAKKEAAQVTDFGGYRAVLSRFINSMDDAHVSISFRLAQTSLAWPGFLAVYQGRRFLTAASEGGAIADGQEIAACDNLPMAEWSRRIAAYEGGFPGLQETNNSMARAIFVDRGNPFVKRPTTCMIGGHRVNLAWRPISRVDYTNKIRAQRTTRSREATITSFGENSAWVKMGYFYPNDKNEAEAFHRLIADAPSLRQKDVIVLDVRGNGGGSYHWPMGFLRGLYGQPYTDHFARARLAIVPVSRAHERVVELFAKYNGQNDEFKAPADIATQWDPKNAGLKRATASGAAYFRPSGDLPKGPTGPAPANPVKSKVYVLTDFACHSVCISFIDETKRIPGLTQIGLETGVDSRTGTPMDIDLPSGNGHITLAVMTRDGRERDDNSPHRPTHEFQGDIRDTAAVQQWIQTEILKKDGISR